MFRYLCLCLRLLKLRLLGLQCGLSTLELQGTDEALVTQFLVALELGSRETEAGLRRTGSRSGGVLPEPEIGVVQLGQ